SDPVTRAVRASSPNELVATSRSDKNLSSISPDGRALLFHSDTGGDNDVYSTSTNPSDKTHPAIGVSAPGHQQDAKFSPDGAWITYTSFESGRPEIFLAP